MTASVPSFSSADRFYVHLVILKELQMYDEAAELLDNEIGKAVCRTSLVCDELRREIWTLKGAVKEEGQRAQDKILKQRYVNSVLSGRACAHFIIDK